MKRFLVILICLFALPLVCFSQVRLRHGHPYRYVVKPGDTLWGIANRFLKYPWEWHQLWEGNPQITYPAELYPGDILELHLLNGRPRLSLLRGGTVRLSPHTRILPLKEPIPTIPINAIKTFLSKSRVVNRDMLSSAPYVISFVGEHITGGARNQIYVRSIFDRSIETFSIYRLGQHYVDPETKESLGWEGSYIGQAQLQKPGDPAILEITDSPIEILVGDRLLPADDQDFTKNFMPKAPDVPVNGDIIGVLGDGVTQIGEYTSIVIDRGRAEGIKVGDVLEVMRHGKTIIDPVEPAKRMRVTLPDQKAGQALVYRTFEYVSYVLIMDAQLPIHVGDKVTNPDEGQYDVASKFEGSYK